MLGLGGRDPYGKPRLRLGSKPRILFGTALGTLACFVVFMKYYTSFTGDSDVWVWFGMRSDGRCGKDFATEWSHHTTCGKGQCCSSHGWCGHGEEYCSVALGCQSGCYESSEEEQRKAEQDERDQHHATEAGEEDDMGRMHQYRYDHEEYERERHHDDGPDLVDRYGHDHYGHHDPYGYRGDPHGYHGGHDYHDYHHRYDEDPDEVHRGYHEDEHEGEDPFASKRGKNHYDDDREPYHPKVGEGAGEAGGPELVGLEEKKHLGTGDGVPLEGEAHH